MRNFIIMVVAVLLATTAVAQDLLVKRNGEKMHVKVLKVTKKKVEYVRFGTEHPIYSLPISDIDYIEYPMGDRDTFGAVAKPATTPTPATVVTPTPATESGGELKRWHGPVPGPDGRLSVPLEEVLAKEQQATYKIGDIYNKDGVVGVVVILTDDGRHGVVMSLDEACLVWSKLPRKSLERVGASSKTDGELNHKSLEKYIADKGLSWSDFPAFEWCRAKGEGWYLPSVNELWAAGTMYMGGSRVGPKIPLRKAFNDNVVAHGGKAVSNVMIYHTSTESEGDARRAQYSHMNGDTPYFGECEKREELFVRAFHKF